jgi:hypothetical protein
VTKDKTFAFRVHALRSKVRYERAVLTVQHWGAVLFTPIADALEAYREEKASADDVAWAFVKTRVIEHTATFNWDRADIGKLLPRITAVTDDPKIEATTPVELVSELEDIEKRELEELDQDRERFRHLSELWPGMFDPDLDLGELMSGGIELSREDGTRVSDATSDWRELEGTMRALFQPETVVDNASFFKATEAMINSDAFSKLRTATGLGFSATVPEEAWPELEALIEQIDYPEFTAAVKDGMQTLERADGLSPDALLNELQSTIASLEKTIQQAKDSPQKTILILVAGNLLTLLTQAVLAKLGVKI